MTTILLTGMPGCGKEEFLKAVIELGYDVIRMGDVVRDYARKEGIPGDDRNIGNFAGLERKKHHPAIWAERTLERLTDSNSVIDGVRSYDEVDRFKNSLGTELMVVAVHASPVTRFERLQDRARDDAPGTRAEFDRRDERELRWGLGSLIARADIMLVNEGTLEEFRKDAKKLLETVSSQHETL